LIKNANNLIGIFYIGNISISNKKIENYKRNIYSIAFLYSFKLKYFNLNA